MPRRGDLGTIVIVGSGPIVIGQACEFDYSGVQACKALRAEGYRVALVNPNPATIMTDPELADATYVEPLTADSVERVLDVEVAEVAEVAHAGRGATGVALLPTLGGQTGLNVAIELADGGVLERLGVELIGANRETITVAEDRERFAAAMRDIGVEVAASTTVTRVGDAEAFAERVGFPILVRASYTLGGAGSGLARDREQFARMVGEGLAASPIGQVQLDESLLGWKEFELEVMRDANDSCVVICSIENVDAMGVHTGDSVTVAPAMTLADVEYQGLRDTAFAVLRRVGVETGGSNVQFAVDPATGRQVVVEMNPRVSRSSALASKATGFPIAKVAALLAVGYRLDELRNDITRETGAAFEPAIDYVVTKIPRFAFEKFPGVDATLTTRMKSVGEVMAIGATFTESLSKALASLEDGTIGLLGRPSGFVPPPDTVPPDVEARAGFDGAAGPGQFEAGEDDRRLAVALAVPHARRLQDADAALTRGWSIEAVAALTGYDPWFVDQLARVVEVRRELRGREALANVDPGLLARAKRHGLTDAALAEVLRTDESDVRARRTRDGVTPVFRTVDTCAGEFPAVTPYHYGTYSSETEVAPSDRPRVIILGSGPNRIGQGIEFDACCVQAVGALRTAGYETVMVNCNPETVSTDYDIADRLYFEPLTLEHVLAVHESELAAVGGDTSKVGVLCQLGGQTPLGLARELEAAGVRIHGTPPHAIDLAEDRGRFGAILDELGIAQAPGEVAASPDAARSVADRVGYPVLVRPSYVLGGRAMAIVYTPEQLSAWLAANAGEGAVLVDRFLEGAVEVDVDAVYDGHELFVGGVLEHIEEAGVHSGDSACVTPPLTLGPEQLEGIRADAEALAARLGTGGLINLQFAVRDDRRYCIEANPRASRTVPFTGKATGVPLVQAAARVMLGATLAELRGDDEGPLLPPHDAVAAPVDGHVAVKEAVLPFNRFPGVDTRLGPEMRSTGEVMGIDTDFGAAFAKSQAGTGTMVLPTGGTAFVSMANRDKRAMIFPVKRLADLGFKIVATTGTAAVLRRVGVNCEVVGKVSDAPGQWPSVVQRIEEGDVDLVLNTPAGQAPRTDGYRIRTAAVAHGVPCITTLSGMLAAVQGIEALREGRVVVRSLQQYHGGIGSAGRPVRSAGW
ncbi:carbamoyl-phosphate synthase large subunit [Egibacter rhizosphaerae]|uniref:Carbamoyl phosphate synthase large chain n=1 Tax=Egibacter rhizosphaerae TaxID=1670831 RepID=A0A411YK03_9ACTN|nr:carbamoyl-phosphate synthase large subunit [Egibacter rhizosphaerae]QBI21538.1 carbamoyl-phosphate synthase large subunit [Egibacter rhizosphaerae]